MLYLYVEQFLLLPVVDCSRQQRAEASSLPAAVVEIFGVHLLKH